MTKLRRRVGKTLAAMTFLLGACGGSNTTGRVISVDGLLVPAAQLQRSVASLCEVQRFIGQEDLTNAKAVFQDRSHPDLHTLASALEDKDREATSLLLRIKNRVESDFSGGDLAALKADLPSLIEAAEAGLKSLSVDPLPCANSP